MKKEILVKTGIAATGVLVVGLLVKIRKQKILLGLADGTIARVSNRNRLLESSSKRRDEDVRKFFKTHRDLDSAYTHNKHKLDTISSVIRTGGTPKQTIEVIKRTLASE